MQERKNNTLNKTFLILLQPIARLFLRFGRGYREYSDLSKAAFVAVASQDYGVHGRPTNVSRIAAMTGLTRKEISRIRARLESGDGAQTERGTPLQELINGWQSNEEFLDDAGKPAALSLDAGRGSFQALVKRFAGDIPEGAMRKELQRIDRARLEDGLLIFCPPNGADLAAEEAMARTLRAGPYPLLAALAHNEAARVDREMWPVESVGLKSIRKSDVARVRKLVSVRLRAATTTISDLLDAYATVHAGEGTDEATLAVSAGAFYVEVPDSSGK
ncbi:MAG: DUF6502 family protein [Woeseiaceae bacterium]